MGLFFCGIAGQAGNDEKNSNDGRTGNDGRTDNDGRTGDDGRTGNDVIPDLIGDPYEDKS